MVSDEMWQQRQDKIDTIDLTLQRLIDRVRAKIPSTNLYCAVVSLFRLRVMTYTKSGPYIKDYSLTADSPTTAEGWTALENYIVDWIKENAHG